jgi:hypothetical protein
MPPAPRNVVSQDIVNPDSGSTGGAPEDPLVPLLPVEGDALDPVALAMWHLALASGTAVEVPHDLFALWLFPVAGGVVLLGPDALALDRLELPEPSPHLLQDQLYRLEELLRHAKYASAIAVPIRHAARDAGLMLLGRFTLGGFDREEVDALHRLAGQLVPAFTRLAALTPWAAPHANLEPAMSLEALPDHLVRVASEAASGPDLVRRVSGVLYPLLPHDRLEILAAGPTEGALLPLSGAPRRRRWGTGGAGGAIEPYSAIAARFGSQATLLVADLTEGNANAAWGIGGGTVAGRPARGLVGARLEVGGELVGYLLLASVARGAYRPEDEEAVGLVARLLAPRVAGIRLAVELGALRARLGAEEEE